MDVKELKAAVKKCEDRESVVQALGASDFYGLKPSAMQFLSRQINRFQDENAGRIAYLGNFTIEPLNDYVKVMAFKENFMISEYIGGYNQYFPEIMDKYSALNAFDPHIILLALSIRKLAPEIYYSFSSLSTEAKKDHLDIIVSTISDWAEKAKENSNASILICNFTRPDYPGAGIADMKQQYSEYEFYFDLNIELLQRFRNDPRVFIFDLERLSARFGRNKIMDQKMYYLAKMEWSEKFLPFIADEMIRFIKAFRSMTRKCLVLDLDNTLWGGVLGEEGPMGVRVGHDDSEAEAYYDFQRRIISLKERGILLAVCSKNNLEDVQELFEKRKDMPLKIDDFAAMEVNWENKNENIQKIAETLNLGTDSIVFIDDNPAECRLVEMMMPEVKTVCLSGDPAGHVGTIDALMEFEKAIITNEDSEKTGQYRQNARRNEHMQKIGDIETYLRSLKTEIVIRSANDDDLTRVHQLFNKTNQFNVTTRRYSQGEIEEYFNQKHYDLSVVEARDQFGVIGTIGLYIVEIESVKKIRIDSFILSCRAMGRGIESAMMNSIKSKYIINGSADGTEIRSEYIPTQKNRPVKTFFEQQGFSVIEKKEGGETLYIMESKKAELINCDWICVMTKEKYDGR